MNSHCCTPFSFKSQNSRLIYLQMWKQKLDVTVLLRADIPCSDTAVTFTSSILDVDNIFSKVH